MASCVPPSPLTSPPHEGFYYIIPAWLAEHEKCSAIDALVYGVVSSLCNKEGYCWATNEFIAQKLGISKRSVQRSLKNLEDFFDIIRVENLDARKIYLRLPSHGGVTPQSRGGDSESRGGDSESPKYYNKVIKEVIYNVQAIDPATGQSPDDELFYSNSFEEFWELYAKKEGRMKCERAWRKLKQEEIHQILKNVPIFKLHFSARKWTPRPYKYIYNRYWEDQGFQTPPQTDNDRQLYSYEEMLGLCGKNGITTDDFQMNLDAKEALVKASGDIKSAKIWQRK